MTWPGSYDDGGAAEQRRYLEDLTYQLDGQVIDPRVDPDAAVIDLAGTQRVAEEEHQRWLSAGAGADDSRYRDEATYDRDYGYDPYY